MNDHLPDERDLERLARATLAGDLTAFGRFSLAIWPVVEAAVRRRASTAERADEAQEVFTRLLERLETDDCRALRAYDAWKERHPEKGFLDWIRIVIANLSRDRLRERVGRTRPDEADLPSAKRLLNELAQLEPLDATSFRPPITSQQTAREILQYAAKQLPPLQLRALSAWLEGASFEELRVATGLETEESAARVVRAALATLRRAFVVDE